MTSKIKKKLFNIALKVLPSLLQQRQTISSLLDMVGLKVGVCVWRFLLLALFTLILTLVVAKKKKKKGKGILLRLSPSPSGSIVLLCVPTFD